MKRLVSALGAATWMMCAATPMAAARSGERSTVTIDVKARVAERCGIEAVGSIANTPVRIDEAQALTFNFNLDCNTAFRIGVRAGNGALRLTTAAARARDLDGFGIEREYAVALDLTTDAGTASAGQCSSRALFGAATSCPFFGRPAERTGFSPGEHVTAINRPGTIKVTWPAESTAGPRLAAGTYQDTLTVEVGPRL